MKARDLVELANRNLREAMLRNSLTTLGIAVGVASLVAMLSLGVGLQNLASERLSRTGLFDAIFVAPQTNLNGFGRPVRPANAPAEPPRPLDEDARHQIEALPEVVEVYPEIRFPTEIRFAGNPYPTVVAGLAPSARSDGAFDGMKGTYFSSPSADEAILQIDFARELSNQPDTLIGQEIVLRYAERQALPADTAGGNSGGGFSIVPREEKLRIVGIVETEPAAGMGGFGRGRLLIPLQVAETLRAAQATDLRDLLRDKPSQRTYESLTVRVKGASQVQGVEDALKQMGFTAFSLLDATRNLRLVFAVFDLLLGIFGSLALVVASLGIINTLVMAILERRREIGVLKALGAADRDVRRLFFVEAGAMGLLGGVFGVLMGWLIGRAINFGTNIYLTRQQLPSITIASVPWWMVAAAIAFSIGVSLAAGIYPASRAARLDPVEALRYE
ncbi:MAG TPA: FtsX-like permease family protein [Candidatus Acidoferrales bacterium]|nr:FtsX-like permease family protein [Candidatus Acidoferrales bacterium]